METLEASGLIGRAALQHVIVLKEQLVVFPDEEEDDLKTEILILLYIPNTNFYHLCVYKWDDFSQEYDLSLIHI